MIETARILLVEDDRVQATLILDLLGSEGYQTTWRTSLADARRTVPEAAWDLFLLDRVLPDGDGTDLCQELRCNPATQALPIIIITGRDRPDERVEGLVRGADDYIPKPFHAKEFLARVRACLRTLSLQRELMQKAEELARKNEELERAQAELVRSQRLAAIGEVGLAIRHEINNPLGTVLGYTELLLTQAEGVPEDVQRKLEAVRRASLRIRDVVRRLEVLRDDRTVEYVPGVNMTDLRGENQTPGRQG
ncbi:MAG TPA: response regulator [Candidatus Sulfotelmatobacter sp.]|nr:response regulator [Candidatus Sulfotelmatobacter sp.]